MEINKLYNADCLEVMGIDIDEKSIDIVHLG